ncbi:MAG: hypothetical protein JNJ45_03455 [Chthonomonas sp.]|nr:hypothetical protein [Chthonomonas sp.]
MKVKICALTREMDVELAIELGADAVGFVVEPTSKRALTPERAKELARIAQGKAQTVVVFGEFYAFKGIEGFDLVQYRWSPGATPRERQRPALTLDHAPRWEPAQEFILEPTVAGQFGGTGQLADWDAAHKLVEQGYEAMHLAGGLTPDNVAAAIAKVQPFGVDVASGTEASYGIKDPARMRDFIAAAKL